MLRPQSVKVSIAYHVLNGFKGWRPCKEVALQEGQAGGQVRGVEVVRHAPP